MSTGDAEDLGLEIQQAYYLRNRNRLSGLLENRGVTEDHKDTERIFRDAEIQILRAKHDEILQVLTSTETNVERTRMLEAESFEKDKKIEALEAECAAFKEDIRHLELRNLDLELQVKVASDNESDLRRIQSNQESALQNMERIVQAERSANADLQVRLHDSLLKLTQAEAKSHEQSATISKLEGMVPQLAGPSRERAVIAPIRLPAMRRESDHLPGEEKRPKTSRRPVESVLPIARKEVLVQFPDVVVGGDTSQHVGFGRIFLSSMLGGGSVDLNVKIVTPKPLSTALNIQHYICPKLSDNPWCPSTPGQHGYMFVGLGRDKDRYKDPQERNLFLGVASADFRYMGVYRVHAVSPLTVDEWNTLPDDFQKSYSFLTSSKNKFPGINWTPKECREAYDSGRLQVPCVQLTCVGFNDMLYRELAKSKPVSPGKKRPADSMPDGLPVPTRKSQRLSL